MVAERSYFTSEVRGSSQECQAATVQEWPREAAGAVAKRSNPTSKVRRGGCEEIPLIQGKEQRLRFALEQP